MDELWSDAVQEAYAHARDDVVLPTLEIRVEKPGDTVAALRMVRDRGTLLVPGDPDVYGHVLRLEADAPLDAGKDVEFVGTMFDFELPEQKDGPLPSIAIGIDNVARFLSVHIDEAVAGRKPIEVTYREYLASDPQTVQFKVGGMGLNSVKSTLARVEGAAEFVNLVNANFPNRVYEPDEFPGLD